MGPPEIAMARRPIEIHRDTLRAVIRTSGRIRGRGEESRSPIELGAT